MWCLALHKLDRFLTKKRINPKKYIKTENFAAPKVKLEDIKKRKYRTYKRRKKTCYGNTCELFIALFGFFFLLMHNIYTTNSKRFTQIVFYDRLAYLLYTSFIILYFNPIYTTSHSVIFNVCHISQRACFSPKFIRSTAITAVGLSFYGTTLLWLHTTKLTSEDFLSLECVNKCIFWNWLLVLCSLLSF